MLSVNDLAEVTNPDKLVKPVPCTQPGNINATR